MSHEPLSAPPPAGPPPPPRLLKAILIGDASTGKTSLRQRFISGGFSPAYRATIGCDFLGRKWKAGKGDGDEVNLQVWDTAGTSPSSLLPFPADRDEYATQVRSASARSPRLSTAPRTPASSSTRSRRPIHPTPSPARSAAGSTSSPQNAPSRRTRRSAGASAGSASGPRRTRSRPTSARTRSAMPSSARWRIFSLEEARAPAHGG